MSPVTGWGAAPQMARGQPTSLGSLSTWELGWGVRSESLQRKSKVDTGAEVSPGTGGHPSPEIGNTGGHRCRVPGGPTCPSFLIYGAMLAQSAGMTWALLHSAGGAEVRACSVVGSPATSPGAGSQ